MPPPPPPFSFASRLPAGSDGVSGGFHNDTVHHDGQHFRYWFDDAVDDDNTSTNMLALLPPLENVSNNSFHADSQSDSTHHAVDDVVMMTSGMMLPPTLAGQSEQRQLLGSGRTTSFPFLLYKMLEESAQQGSDNIVSWMPCGRAFKVKNRVHFDNVILPRYFNSTKFKSFQRQLNLYCFCRLSCNGPYKGSYTHEFFIRGEPQMCHRIKRVKVKNKYSRGDGDDNKEVVTNKKKAEDRCMECQEKEEATIKNSTEGQDSPRSAAADKKISVGQDAHLGASSSGDGTNNTIRFLDTDISPMEIKEARLTNTDCQRAEEEEDFLCTVSWFNGDRANGLPFNAKRKKCSMAGRTKTSHAFYNFHDFPTIPPELVDDIIQTFSCRRHRFS